MATFVSLSCPSCGGKLQVTNDIDRFACGYCGQEHTVNRSGGMVLLKPVLEELRLVQIGVDKTAAELAIQRIQGEINAIDEQIGNLPRPKFIPAYKKMELSLQQRVAYGLNPMSKKELDRERQKIEIARREFEQNKESLMKEHEDSLRSREQKIALLEQQKAGLQLELAKCLKIVKD